MEAYAEHLFSDGKTIVLLSEGSQEQLDALAKDKVSDSKLQTYIDNLDISADAKQLIASILKATVKLGDLIIRVGKRIVEIVVMLASNFPNATFGLILGLLIGVLIASVPILGALLGPVITPIAAAFGLTSGYMDDIKDKNLTRKVAEAAAMFDALKGDSRATC